jgi:hypothetical protein
VSDHRDFKHTFTVAVESAGWGGEIWDRRRGEHPDAGLLAAYHDGDLAAADVAALQEHLSTCSECAGLVMDRAAFPDLPAADGEPGELGSARAWRRLEKALPPVEPRTLAAAGVPPWRRTAVAWAAAAGLAVACVGLGGWNLHLEQESRHLEQRVVELTAPQPNLPLFNLGSGIRRGGEEAHDPVVPAQDGIFILYFYPGADLETYAAFEWSIAEDGSGEVVLAGGDLRPAAGLFTLGLHGEALAPGTYRLQVRGLPAGGGDAEPLGGDYRFLLAAE